MKIFTGKFVAIFFKAKNFKPNPPFLHQVPPNKCLWTVPKAPGKMSNQNISLTKTIIRSRRTYIFVCHLCLFTFYCDQLFPVLPLTFACFCEILYVAYSAVDVCFYLVSYIVYIFGNQVGILFIRILCFPEKSYVSQLWVVYIFGLMYFSFKRISYFLVNVKQQPNHRVDVLSITLRFVL